MYEACNAGPHPLLSAADLAVVPAAEGKFPPESVAEILERGDRKAAGPTVPPGGLYMTQLWYDDGEVSFHVG